MTENPKRIIHTNNALQRLMTVMFHRHMGGQSRKPSKPGNSPTAKKGGNSWQHDRFTN